MPETISRIDLQGVNCYLTKGKQGFVLFDTGGHLTLDKVFTSRREDLQKELETAGCTKENLSLIVLTHGDCDHAGNAAFLREKYHAKIAMHSADRVLVEAPALQTWMASFQYRSPLFRLVFRLMQKNIIAATQKALEDFEPFSPDILLENHSTLSDFGLDAAVVPVPGHTKGSVAFLFADGSLIVGDTFANPKKPVPAPNAADFAELYDSIQKLKKSHAQTVYPGHGKPFPFSDVTASI